MLKNKAARLAAVLTTFVATFVASSAAALAMNEPGPGGADPTPHAVTVPIASISASGPNWALLASGLITLVVVAALFLLLRGVRLRAVRHA